MAAMDGGVVYFCHGRGCGVVVVVGCGKKGNVLVLKKVIRTTHPAFSLT